MDIGTWPNSLSSLKKVEEMVHKPEVLRHRSVIGVDIGSSCIKIVELRHALPRPRLETYGIIQLEAKGSNDALENNRKTAAILDLMQEVGVSSKVAGISLPLSSIFLSLIETVKRDAEQLRHIIHEEARRYIPISLDNVSLVWQRIPEEAVESAFTKAEQKDVAAPRPQKILLVATANDTISHYQAIAHDANLSVAFFEAEVFSAVRSISQEIGESLLLLDVGVAGSKVYIIDERGNALFTHYLETIPGSKTGGSETIVKLAGETKKMIGTFNDAHPKKPVTKCILLGGGAMVAEMAQYMHQALGLPAKNARPFDAIEAPMILEDVLKEVGPLYANACGLALRALSAA